MHRSAGNNIAKESLGESAGVPRQADTIAAIATAPGEAAIALVRISGEGTIAVAEKVFRGRDAVAALAPQTQHLGELVDDAGRMIDQVVLSLHRAPHSYTGEDLIEISCHGGVLVTARVLERCLQAGARPARAGEFTERAFFNGKMDLTQAEAVIDLIRARTDLALRSATEQLEGRLGDEIRALRDELIGAVAHVEASIDFPEEGIEPDEGSKLDDRLADIEEKIGALLATADQGRILREGVRVVIYGPTNAGKSSLLNRLLGYERAIVSDTPGTTRDTIEESVNLGGVAVRLLDTAGLRASADVIEQAGMERTKTSVARADLRLHIADGHAPKAPEFQLPQANGADLLVINKSDLSLHNDWQGADGVRISCLTGAGMTELQERIVARITEGNLRPESGIAINARHRDCLRRAGEACARARQAQRSGLSAEYLAIDLHESLRALAEILGEVDIEQVLDSVFGQFCIGK